MARVEANGIHIEYETFGDRSGRPLFLLRGLSTQLIHWDHDFCHGLVEQGHFVTIFDNRDVGLSTWFDDAGLPDMAAIFAGQKTETAYGLDDMADDTVGLMDALGLESAHVAGISMGGMIAQAVALRHPSRIRSLISIMSSTGAPDLPPATPAAMEALLSPAPAERAAYIDHTMRSQRAIGSPGFAFDDEREAARAGRAFDRAFHPDGSARQLAAVRTHGDRSAGLSQLSVPTLVLHGSADPLIPPEHGENTAAVIPGAELHLVEGMGHDIPRGGHAEIIEKISQHTARADSR